ncbi:MAG: Ni,Fe-hydrogenase III large subunit [Gammaproteobacteria bacterium]|nr:Ni,Fe-hydrogenase III large subunit [Gammaproteobacteria bacterium]
MPLRRWSAAAAPLAGSPGTKQIVVARENWRARAQEIAAAGGRLMALWASGPAATGRPAPRTLYAAFVLPPGLLVLTMPDDLAHDEYPGIEEVFPHASRMQRALFDVSGWRSSDPDVRPWLRHAAWPADFHPLIHETAPTAAEEPRPDDYAFVRVEGEGVHEIAVGPVHAGIIEPGHFRFSVVGEKVLKLEERLGYAHKGVERRFTELPILEGHRLAARLCGDSTVTYAWAYCQALEGLAGTPIPARAAWLRALALELERAANHLGDLGALGNDAGFAFGLSQFSLLKEQLLRATHAAFGQRYLLDFVVPGGTRADLAPEGARALSDCAGHLAQQTRVLRGIYDEHAGLRDRFAGAGMVTPALAARLGLTGLVGRASGQAHDLRSDAPWAPYDELAPGKAGATEGDVAARVAVRFDELFESCRLIGRIVRDLPGGTHLAAGLPTPPEGALGIGLIEGWRGPVMIALEAGASGSIRRCHPHDPSWQNWPVLEHAIIGNIVPDFPLINKSFNLAYSGHDL